MIPVVDTPRTDQELQSFQPQSTDEPTLLHEFFDQAALRHPTRIAIDTPPGADRSERRKITYAELKRQANVLANRLREVVTEECVVAIMLPRNSEHLYLAQLAVLKAGAAYAFIDPAFPDEQMDNILDDARAVAILTDGPGLVRARSIRSPVSCVLNVIDWTERNTDIIEPLSGVPWLTPSSLAYIIYTSGTTGRPKGVMIEHAGIVNLVQGDLCELGVTFNDRVGQSSSASYDSSVEESWFALAAGATLVVMDDETARLGPDLIPWLRRERISVFCPPPTLLRATGCENPDEELPDLRLLYVGGEPLPSDVAERWSRGRCLVNGYGPTETSVTVLRGRIMPGDTITIGTPIPGIQAWVLNDTLEEVADGDQGELCLAGVGLARGYRNSPELTEQKFPLHPLLGRIYRTGDLVHRDADGNYFCHGRIDSQVKIRGYRIELEAIEARLAECPGVREAACRVQGYDAQQRIAAFIVPKDCTAPPCFDVLRESLLKVLPEYMVPCRYAAIVEIPRNTSGKLNRKALPFIEGHVPEAHGPVASPHNALEAKLALAFQEILGVKESVSVDHDFFHDLGGDSLLAAQLISRLRDDETTAALTVRDVYELRTVARLARRVAASTGAATEAVAEDADRPAGRPILATVIQTVWLLAGLMLGAPAVYVLAFHLLPLLADALGLVPLLLLSPLLYLGGLLAYAAATSGLAVVVKKVLIGRYQPAREPVWGGFYVRNWMVQQTVRLIPWRFLEGTVFQFIVLRALGARIGRGVHVHRGVNLLNGGWDLLDIGDDVTISQDVNIRLVELEDGQIVIGPVTLESGSTLDVRAGVAGNTHLEADAYLAPLSFLPTGGRVPRGERWDGVPAKPAGQSPARPDANHADDLSPATHSLAMIAGRVAVVLFVALPLEILALAFVLHYSVDVETAAAWLFNPTIDASTLLLATTLVTLGVPLTLLFQGLAMRLMGRVRDGVISRWSLAYVRVWLKAGVLESASNWLSGTLFWPIWLRLAGMKIGRGCEISTIIDTIPELVDIGPDTFFADGIYLAGPRVHRGAVTLATVRLGANTFLGNHAVIAGGQALPNDILLGVSTVADDHTVRPGTSWFGHPPFELPKREVVECDRRLTHEPSWIRYINRVFWELLRFTIPIVPVLLVFAWFKLLALAAEAVALPVLLCAVVPALDFAILATLCLLVLALKWALLGRVRPGTHPLWSCWCSRWDFHYVVWDKFAFGPLSALEGTLLLNWYLRGMGMRIGKNVVLGSGFAHVVDPDMLTFEDGATVYCMFQAHTFEDRVLKIDHVVIRRQATVGAAAVVLYGADIGIRAHVMPHSVVMKREKLLPGQSYAGCPTQVRA